MQCYLNEFTHEYWRGHKDKSLAPDYVARQLLNSFHAPLLYIGRINHVITDDQIKLKALRQEILNNVFLKK